MIANEFFNKTRLKLEEYQYSLKVLVSHYEKLTKYKESLDYFIEKVFDPILQDILSFDKQYIELQEKKPLKELVKHQREIYSLFDKYNTYKIRGNKETERRFLNDLFTQISEAIMVMNEILEIYMSLYNRLLNSYNQYYSNTQNTNEKDDFWSNLLLSIGIAGIGALGILFLDTLLGNNNKNEKKSN